MSLYELIHEFLFDCKVRELSEQTVKNYDKQLHKFFHFIKDNCDLLCYIARPLCQSGLLQCQATIELLSPDMVFIDANGTIVHHQYPQESSRVRGGQSAVLTGYCDLSLNPVAVYVDHYTYTMNGTHQDDLVEEPFVYELP